MEIALSQRLRQEIKFHLLSVYYLPHSTYFYKIRLRFNGTFLAGTLHG